MASPVRGVGSSVSPSCASGLSLCTSHSDLSRGYLLGYAVLSLEFVARPEKARIVPTALPPSIQAAFEEIDGFSGCLVLASDQEPRLITVLLLWNGSEACRRRTQSIRRMRALLEPYMDRCLRFQTLAAHRSVHRARQSRTNQGASVLMGEEDQIQEESVFLA